MNRDRLIEYSKEFAWAMSGYIVIWLALTGAFLIFAEFGDHLFQLGGK